MSTWSESNGSMDENRSFRKKTLTGTVGSSVNQLALSILTFIWSSGFIRIFLRESSISG
jgi:hypothetical protein